MLHLCNKHLQTNQHCNNDYVLSTYCHLINDEKQYKQYSITNQQNVHRKCIGKAKCEILCKVR